MKQISAFVDPTKLDELRQHLKEIGVHVLSLRSTHSIGRKPGRRMTYRGAVFLTYQVSEVEVTFVIHDENLPEVIAIFERQGTDSDILISPVDQVVRCLQTQ